MSFMDFATALVSPAAAAAKWLDLDGSKARRDLDRSYADGSRNLEAGYGEARDIGQRYHDEARGYLQPYVQGGREADTIYRNALGINGRDAQAGYYQNFQTDPGFEAELNAGVGALDRSAAARGRLYSGGQLKAVSRYGQQMLGNAHRNRLAMLGDYAGRGQQVAGQAAGMTQQFGSDQAGLRYGHGQQVAGNRINFGNAMAENRGTLMRNVLGLGQVAANAYGAGVRR